MRGNGLVAERGNQAIQIKPFIEPANRGQRTRLRLPFPADDNLVAAHVNIEDIERPWRRAGDVAAVEIVDSVVARTPDLAQIGAILHGAAQMGTGGGEGAIGAVRCPGSTGRDGCRIGKSPRNSASAPRPWRRPPRLRQDRPRAAGQESASRDREKTPKRQADHRQGRFQWRGGAWSGAGESAQRTSTAPPAATTRRITLNVLTVCTPTATTSHGIFAYRRNEGDSGAKRSVCMPCENGKDDMDTRSVT